MKNLLVSFLLFCCALYALDAQSEFTDNLDSYNTGLWTKADGWANGTPFNCTWRADCITFSNSQMRLAIDKDTGTNPPYKASEYRSTQNYQYGFFECRLKTVKKSGTVCSLVLYTGPSAGTIWDEIDIEILCKDTTQMQCNYYADSEGGHEHMVNLGFDSASDFHTYGWEWQTGFITWYVDGKPVYTVTNSGQKFPKTASMYICTFWNGTATDWQGAFDGVVPVYVYYDWVKYLKSNPYTSVTVEPTAAVTPAPTTASCPCTTGDVNCSGNIDIVDALLGAQYYVGLNPSNFNSCAADVNKSGSIDIVDALLMAQCYVGLVSCSF